MYLHHFVSMLSLMLCQLQDQGGVGESSGTQTVRQEIAFVREELKTVTLKIDGVEVEIKECKDPEEKKQLREKEKQLRDKEARLEQKELIFLQQQSGANSNLCISSRFPPFSSLLSSFFASLYHPTSIPRFPCICFIFSSSECCWCRAFVCVWELEFFQRVRLFVRLFLQIPLVCVASLGVTSLHVISVFVSRAYLCICAFIFVSVWSYIC